MTDLGKQFRQFKAKVCTAYHIQELDREVGVRSRRQAKEAAKRAERGKANDIQPGTATRKPKAGANTKGKEKASSEQSQDVPGPMQPWRKKSFNFQTYKFHVLGDYMASIRRFGTTDSYSTEPVSYRPLPVHSSTHFSSGRVRASHAERQIPSHRSKGLCSPADSN